MSKSLNDRDTELTDEEAKALAASFERLGDLPKLAHEHLLDTFKTHDSFLDNIREQFEALHTFPDQWAQLAKKMSVGRSLMEMVAKQQEAASSIIESARYTSAIEGFAKQMESLKETMNKSVGDLPEVTLTPFTKQAIEDASALREDSASPYDTGPLFAGLAFTQPANQNDVAVIEEKIDIVTDQLLNLSKALVASKDVAIYCAPCNVLMAKVQFMLLGQIKCYRCGKLRNIPSKDVRIVMPTLTT